MSRFREFLSVAAIKQTDEDENRMHPHTISLQSIIRIIRTFDVIVILNQSRELEGIFIFRRIPAGYNYNDDKANKIYIV